MSHTTGQHDHGHHDHGQHDHGHHNHGQHDHGQHDHDLIGLVAPRQLARLSAPVHRIGRRRFLTELGRNTFAVAILGGLVAACSDSNDDAEVAVPSGTSAPSSAPSSTSNGGPTSLPAGESELRWSQVSLGSVSAYVLVRGNQAAVVDTGNPGSADEIGATLITLGVTYDDVRHVVLTHRHNDHVGSLSEVADRAATSVVYAGADDIDEISSSLGIQAVGDGDDVFGLQVIDTPGHTPGSISLLDTGIGLLIAGDALNGNGEGTAVTGPNERFTGDMSTAEASVAKLAGFDFEAVAFGHGNPVLSGASGLVVELAEAL